MSQEEYTKKKKHPTMLQLKYLIELEKAEKKRGSIAMIAQACGVNHAAVSRYLKTCCENGKLTAEYEFTEAGKEELQGYKTLLRELPAYLRSVGVPEKEIPDNVRDMIENMDYHTLISMLYTNREMSRKYSVVKEEVLSRNFLKEVLAYGNWPVHFMLFRQGQQSEKGISMANRGFETPGLLRHNRRGSWLELSIREMSANSRITGRSMSGHLESLKYEQNGLFHQAKIRDNSVRIPLEACRFHKRLGGEIKGMITVTITCSVGRMHMPESTALLIFWA